MARWIILRAANIKQCFRNVRRCLSKWITCSLFRRGQQCVDLWRGCLLQVSIETILICVQYIENKSYSVLLDLMSPFWTNAYHTVLLKSPGIVEMNISVCIFREHDESIWVYTENKENLGLSAVHKIVSVFGERIYAYIVKTQRHTKLRISR